MSFTDGAQSRWRLQIPAAARRAGLLGKLCVPSRLAGRDDCFQGAEAIGLRAEREVERALVRGRASER